MLAILEDWRHMDNTSQWALDSASLYVCWRRLHTSFLSVCGVSVVLADTLMSFMLVIAWLLNLLKAPVWVCFLLAHFSAVFSMLPLPMLVLGFLDYFLHDRCSANHKPVWLLRKNIALASLVWLLTLVSSYGTANSNQLEIVHFGELKCLLDQPHDILKSDLLLNTAGPIGNEDAAAKALAEIAQQPPSLWISFMLGFASVWLPYLILSTLFVLLGLGIPAYIAVNMLWLECTNTLLVGLVFWLKSNESGQYNLQDDVCLLRVFFYLSRRAHMYEDVHTTKHNLNTVSHQFDQATHFRVLPAPPTPGVRVPSAPPTPGVRVPSAPPTPGVRVRPPLHQGSGPPLQRSGSPRPPLQGSGPPMSSDLSTAPAYSWELPLREPIHHQAYLGMPFGASVT
ncbi:hypothetical protein N1851_007607 [Merluccius polli]|uniref:Uncharacterized protein n=1 Tax=Merluccius polli TaxID=89951 RepID=A0AA47N3L5_MERPO|nr:hypothetical protein N1851_007607 [Merluccius polli]